MVRGELQPEPLRWYMKPVLADLAYDALSKDPFPTPQEAQVWFNFRRCKEICVCASFHS